MAVLYGFAPENFLAAAATNFPQYLFSMAGGAYRSGLSFDNVTSQKCRSCSFIMPTFTSPLTLKALFITASITGNIQYRAQVEAVTSADAQNLNTTTSFDTANSSGAIIVPSNTFTQKQFSITLTNNSLIAVGDLVTITLDRDVLVASNASAACIILAVSFEDAS